MTDRINGCKTINCRITKDFLIDLFHGKRISFSELFDGEEIRVVLHPPFEGKFLTHEEIHSLRGGWMPE